jgi:hypothetical protein
MDVSTPLLDDANVLHVVQVSPCNAHFKGTTSSSKGVSMNTTNFTSREEDRITSLLTLHKQACFGLLIVTNLCMGIFLS